MGIQHEVSNIFIKLEDWAEIGFEKLEFQLEITA